MVINHGLTVKELFLACQDQIAKGNGNKFIQISQDDEGNGFHALFFSFTDDTPTLQDYLNQGMVETDLPASDFVILG